MRSAFQNWPCKCRGVNWGLGLFLQVEGGMDYKAKAVAGLLAATCVFSIIALILSVVNVKDVFLPPSTKVGSLGGVHLPAFAWLLAAPLV